MLYLNLEVNYYSIINVLFLVRLTFSAAGEEPTGWFKEKEGKGKMQKSQGPPQAWKPSA